jgi:chaperone BCS1
MLPFVGGDFVQGGALLIIFGALLAYFRNLPSRIYSLIERFCIVKVDIQEEDESFQWVKLWLAKILSDSLSVSVFTRRAEAAPEWEDDPSKLYQYVQDDNIDKRPRIVFTPSPGWYWFFYEGTLVTLSKDRTEPEGKNENATLKPRESFTLRLFTRNVSKAKKLVEEARDHALPKDGKIEIRTCSQNYWNLTGRIRPRPIESVVLEGDTSNLILSDVRKFQKSSEWYTKLGVPYRRGYLLYGPPGNGKSSFVLSIASELGMHVNVLNLASIGMTDGKLVELLSNVDTNTLVLMEDIDCAFVKRKSGEDRKGKLDAGLTFSGVLNALDGILAQDGRIIFMTTNHPEKLDKALTRPGRADVKVYIGNATKEQMRQLYRRFYPKIDEKMSIEFSESLPDKVVSMARIQHHLMAYRDDPVEALKRIQEIVKVEEYENSK